MGATPAGFELGQATLGKRSGMRELEASRLVGLPADRSPRRTACQELKRLEFAGAKAQK
jgi:hypothetical protein